MKTSPDITTVILTRNRPTELQQTVSAVTDDMAALYKGALPPKTSIMIINNGGQTLPQLSHGKNVHIEILEHKNNQGTSARNCALHASTGEILFMLDDDAIIAPGTFRCLSDHFMHRTSPDLVALRVKNLTYEEGCLLPTVFHGCACAFRKEALRSCGGYPQDFGYYAEEYELAFRFFRAGRKCIRADNIPPVLHLRSQSGRNINNITYKVLINTVKVYSNHLPANVFYPAVFDLLKRTRQIAQRENSWRGFAKGCIFLPLLLLHHRHKANPMSEKLCDQICLNMQLRQWVRFIQKTYGGNAHITICGRGRFPALWHKTVRDFDLKCSFIDLPPEDKTDRETDNTSVINNPDHKSKASRIFLCGMSSWGVNHRWKEFFEKQNRFSEIHASFSNAKSAVNGQFDLLNGEHLSAFIHS